MRLVNDSYLAACRKLPAAGSKNDVVRLRMQQGTSSRVQAAAVDS